MKEKSKPIVVLIAGCSLISGVLTPAAQAQPLLSETGTSVLADAFGTATGPEALTISWSVEENASAVYTYSYVVNNPVGDVLLNNNGSPTGNPEVVDAYGVGFDTTQPGAYIMNSQTGGTSDQNNGDSGLFWSFTAVQAGTSSPVLSFQSDMPPTQGYADAQDANPPSPWSSFPNGQTVPIPEAVPEPSITTLLVLTALLLLPLRFTFIRSFVASKLRQ